MANSQEQVTGPELRAWRVERGLRSKDVAALLGYSASYISRCERGYRRLSPLAWRTLCSTPIHNRRKGTADHDSQSVKDGTGAGARDT